MRDNGDGKEANAARRKESGIRVFVYGTLKQGHGNHRAYFDDNDGVEFLGRHLFHGSYVMHNLGYFPCVSKMDAGSIRHDNRIMGEVYRVDSGTLDSLDCLEGHPEWYCREQIDTPWKRAWCYFMPVGHTLAPGNDSNNIIESGCWNASAEELEWIDGQESST